MKKRLFVFFAAALVFLYSGCVSEERPTADVVLEKTVSAMQSVETYRFNMSMVMTIVSSEVEQVAVGQSMGVFVSGDVDEKNRRMHTKMKMDVAGMSAEFDQYIVNDTQYMQIPLFGWVKNETGRADMWEKQSYAQWQNELADEMNIALLEDEQIDGVECYLLDVNMSADNIMSLMATGSQTQADAGDIKSMSFKEWVDKDSFLVKKAYVVAAVEEQGSLVEMEMTLHFYGYNEPVETELPAEAENALDLNSLMAGSP